MFSKQLFSNICLIVAALIWGTAFVAQTTGMEHIGPLTFTNLRFLIGGLIVLPLAVKEIPNFKKSLNKRFDRSSDDLGQRRVINWLNHHGNKLKNNFSIKAYLHMNNLLSTIGSKISSNSDFIDLMKNA